MTIELDFAGWYQCRLATDPDDFNEPRGHSGWTFAFGNEPDLDRIIRFHDPVALRSHGPSVGVWIRAVRMDGVVQPGHPLLAARVELLDGAVYEGRNGEIATSAQEPLVPFHLVMSGGGVILDGFDPVDLSDPGEVVRRQPVNFASNSTEVRAATGIGDPVLFRQQRAQAVASDLAAETDPARRLALQARLDELARGGIRRTSLGFQLDYDFALRGPNRLDDPHGVLGFTPVPKNWQVAFWMGGWDADALCGYTKGKLIVADV